jgi:hypothetical protein
MLKRGRPPIVSGTDEDRQSRQKRAAIQRAYRERKRARDQPSSHEDDTAAEETKASVSWPFRLELNDVSTVRWITTALYNEATHLFATSEATQQLSHTLSSVPASATADALVKLAYRDDLERAVQTRWPSATDFSVSLGAFLRQQNGAPPSIWHLDGDRDTFCSLLVNVTDGFETQFLDDSAELLSVEAQLQPLVGQGVVDFLQGREDDDIVTVDERRARHHHQHHYRQTIDDFARLGLASYDPFPKRVSAGHAVVFPTWKWHRTPPLPSHSPLPERFMFFALVEPIYLGGFVPNALPNTQPQVYPFSLAHAASGFASELHARTVVAHGGLGHYRDPVSSKLLRAKIKELKLKT